MASNFNFLKQHGSLFFQLASTSEQIFRIDPNTTLIKLRQLSEALAKDIGSRLNISSYSYDNQNELNDPTEKLQKIQVESLFALADSLEEKIEAAKNE